MKKMYRLLPTLFILFVCISNKLEAQNAFSIGSAATSCTGSPVVTLPIKVRQLTNVGSFQFTVKFDPARFSYVRHSGLSPAFTAGSPLFNWDTTTHIANGQFTFTWLRVGGLTLAPDSTIFTLTLNYLGGGAGSVIYDLAGPSVFEVSDPVGNTLNFTQSGGSVTSVDMQPPVITCPAPITVSSNTPVTVPAATVTGLGDNCAVTSSAYIVSGATMTTGVGSSAATVAFAVGASLVTFGASDAAGNTATCTVSVTVTPSGAPVADTVTLIAVPSQLGCGATQMYVDILADHFDTLGSLQYTVQWNPAFFAFDTLGMTHPSLNLGSSNFNQTQTSGGLFGFSWTALNPMQPSITLPDGSRLVRLYFDVLASGNINQAISFGNAPVPIEAFNNAVPPGYEVPVLVIDGTATTTDITAPSLVCPPNQSLTVPQGQSSILVNNLIAIGTDACDPTLTYSYTLTQNGVTTVTMPNSNNASGNYPIGNTTVAFTATDDAGNTNTCFTNITVSSANPVQIYLDTVNLTCAGASSVEVSVRVRNFADVVGTQFVIAWDETVLSFDTISYLAPGINSQPLNFGNFAQVGNGFMQYIDGNINGWPNIPDGGIFFTMRFDIPLGNINEPIVFINLPGFPFQVYDANVTLLNGITTGGLVISVDTIAPVFSICPTDTIVNTPPTECTVLYRWGGVAVADDCGAIAQLDSNFTSNVFNTGNHLIAYTATDAAGNTTVCSFNVLIKDSFFPNWVTNCPNNITVSAGQNCFAPVNWLAPSAFDNCDQALLTAVSTHTPGQSFSTGPTTVRYMATDQSGNTITCTFVVTVTETVPPIVSCPADTNLMITANICKAAATWADPFATDNCTGMPIITGTHASGDTLPTGFTIVTYTATDASGNTATCSFVVTILENAPPSVICPANQTVSVDNTMPGSCGASVIWSAATATDNCPGQVFVAASTPSGSFLPLGNTTITYTATDASGNTATCTFRVTVVDNVAPVFSFCPPPQVFTLAPTNCNVMVTWQEPVAADVIEGCGLAQFFNTSTFTSPFNFGIGNTTVTYLAIDNAGNVGTCTFSVMVRDTVPPVLTTCPTDTVISIPDCSVVFNYTVPTATDNCDNNVTVITSLPSGSTFTAGTMTEIKIIARDNYQNMDTCMFTVTITGGPTATVSCPTSITQAGCSWEAVWMPPTVSGFCSNTTLSVSPFDLGDTIPSGVHTITYVSTDQNGASASCSFVVTVSDPIAPIIACPQSVTVDVWGGITSDPSGFITSAVQIASCDRVQINFNAPAVTDNCVNVVNVQNAGAASGSGFAAGVTTMSYLATDASGNTSTCLFTITVLDIPTTMILSASSNPVCPGQPLIISAPNITGATYHWSGPAASYPDTSVLVISPAVVGTYMVTISNNGCSATSSAGITITTALQPDAQLDYYSIQTNETDTLRLIANDSIGNGVTLNLLNPPPGIIQLGGGTVFFEGSSKAGELVFEYVICAEDCPTTCDTTEVTIVIKDSPCVYEPNLFTPNGDNLNDEWIIPCLEFDRFPNNSVVIYNQWGDKVYSAAPYKPFPKQGAWNGGLDNDVNKPVPDGTYYYIFRPTPTAPPRKGFIEVLR